MGLQGAWRRAILFYPGNSGTLPWEWFSTGFMAPLYCQHGVKGTQQKGEYSPQSKYLYMCWGERGDTDFVLRELWEVIFSPSNKICYQLLMTEIQCDATSCEVVNTERWHTSCLVYRTMYIFKLLIYVMGFSQYLKQTVWRLRIELEYFMRK